MLTYSRILTLTVGSVLVACGSDSSDRTQASAAATLDGGRADAAIGDANVADSATDGGLPGLAVTLSIDGVAAGSTVAVPCATACVNVTARAEGGAGNYVYTWTDPALSGPGPHRVCPTASTAYGVSVADQWLSASELAPTPRQGSANVQLQRDKCVAKDGDPCVMRAAAGSFDPVVKWSWNGGGSMATPLVANLTDDNGDNRVDLSDTPDVVVVSLGGGGFDQSLFVLDGKTGRQHFRVADVVWQTTPALGDLNGDHLIDIVAVQNKTMLTGLVEQRLVALSNTGREHWSVVLADQSPVALALADLDHDGSPEVLAGGEVFDARGVRRWRVDDAVLQTMIYTAPTAVDLDGDTFLEVVWGPVAYRHDGRLFYRNADLSPLLGAGLATFAAVGDLDGDRKPEIIVAMSKELFVLSSSGSTLRHVTTGGQNSYAFPPALADTNGDGKPEILISNGAEMQVWSPELTLRWKQPVTDDSGIAASSAFDFLGSGRSIALYGDETKLWAFDGADGRVVFDAPRTSGTMIEYPSVADVDNDGSADILVVSEQGNVGQAGLQVISDRTNRWMPARRIFNQDTYHVTNIEEDGTIPRFETPHYTLTNTFRAQAQVAAGKVCIPPK